VSGGVQSRRALIEDQGETKFQREKGGCSGDWKGPVSRRSGRGTSSVFSFKVYLKRGSLGNVHVAVVAATEECERLGRKVDHKRGERKVTVGPTKPPRFPPKNQTKPLRLGQGNVPLWGQWGGCGTIWSTPRRKRKVHHGAVKKTSALRMAPREGEQRRGM